MVATVARPWDDPRLNLCERELGRVLDRCARWGYTDCLHATATLAARLGRCVRHVQRALRRLADLGWIRVIRDYGLRTRRRIRLAWRDMPGQSPGPLFDRRPSGQTDQQSQFFSDRNVVQSTTKPSLSDAASPIRISEEIQRERIDDDKDASSSTACCANSEPDPDPELVSVAELVSRTLGGTPAYNRRRLARIAQAERCGLPTLRKAVEVLRHRVRTWNNLRNPWGFLRGTARNMAAEPPEPNAPPAMGVKEELLRAVGLWPPPAEPAEPAEGGAS